MRCIVGMSGGVDSSVAAFLMQKKGYDIIGCNLQLFRNKKAEANIVDAEKVADFLKIPIEIIDCVDDFENYVINYFVDYYKNGKTPSPCIICNEFIKFKYLNDFRIKRNADILVTGHYAKLEKKQKANGEIYSELYEGLDNNRDQSYFLYAVDGNILAHTEFPLSDFSKSTTRSIAQEAGIPVAQKQDSQDVCFIQNNDYISFIKERLGETLKIENGNIIGNEGKILGKHKGLINYTVGQRKGLALPGGPFFVKKVDTKKNEIIVSDREGIRAERIYLNNTKFINESFEGECKVKIRSRGNKVKAKLSKIDEDWIVDLLEPEYGAAKGQHCVFFKENRILGGGEISEK